MNNPHQTFLPLSPGRRARYCVRCCFLCALSAMIACWAEDIFADLPDEIFTLYDGRQLTGRYHVEQGLLLIAGIGHATMHVNAGMIIKRQEIIKPAQAVIPTPTLSTPKETPKEESSPELIRKADDDVHYQNKTISSPELTLLAVIKTKISNQSQRVANTERISHEEVERIARLKEQQEKLTARYQAAREYAEKYGFAYIGFENNATHQLREALRLLNVCQVNLDAAIDNAANYEARHQEAKQLLQTLVDEHSRLENLLTQDREQP